MEVNFPLKGPAAEQRAAHLWAMRPPSTLQCPQLRYNTVDSVLLRCVHHAAGFLAGLPSLLLAWKIRENFPAWQCVRWHVQVTQLTGHCASLLLTNPFGDVFMGSDSTWASAVHTVSGICIGKKKSQAECLVSFSSKGARCFDKIKHTLVLSCIP